VLYALFFVDRCASLVWRASWQASVLALVVFLATTALRNRLTAAWRYSLWTLVLIRLLLPFAPPASWSPFNLASSLETPVESPRDPVDRTETNRRFDEVAVAPALQAGAIQPEPAATAVPSLPPVRSEPPVESLASRVGWVAAVIWALGAFVAAVDMVRRYGRLRRARRMWCEASDSAILERFAACRERIGVRRDVVLSVAPDGTGPAVSGVRRPRIVVPESLLEDFDPERLDVVLLHELAHVRRRDLVVHGFATAAKAIHWFNPIVWFTLSRMAAEREQACDDMVIEVVGRARRGFYAETILLLLERVVVRPTIPGTVPFFGTVRRIQARLESIANWSRPGLGWRRGFVAMLIGLAVVGLTDSVRKSPAVQGQAVKAEPARPTSDAPVETRISGRIEDHLGLPVADAEVIALGKESLTVYSTLLRGSLVQVNWRSEGVATPPSVKTDAQGRFTIERAEGPVDRLAIVSPKILLWEVATKSLADPSNAVVKLPKPGSMAIDCDIPELPKTQEFYLACPWFNDKNQRDVLLYRGVVGPNPGRVVTSLPPGTYAVERNQFTSLGNWGDLMSQCQRRLVTVDTGKTAVTEFNRKHGLVLEGRVRGLENIKLRYALVTIMYLGPEERFPGYDEPRQTLTGFDVVPIGSDGKFRTTRMPAGKYEFFLSAVRASAEHMESQPPDFSGSASVVVPAEGPAPVVEITAKPPSNVGTEPSGATPSADVDGPRLIVQVRDESGDPVDDFRVQLFAAHRVIPDAIGEAGKAQIGSRDLKDWIDGELIVTAPGFATTFRPQGAVQGRQTIETTLRRGRAVALRIRDSSGRPFGPDVWPSIASGVQVYLKRHRKLVTESFRLDDPESRRRFVAQTNFLDLRQGKESELEFRIPDDLAEPLFFAFHDPERLRYFEVGPVAPQTLASGGWDVKIPEPATVEVQFKDRHASNGESPFASANFMLLPHIPGQEEGIAVFASGELKAPDWRAILSKIAPGNYRVHLATTSKSPVDPSRWREASPGVFAEFREIRPEAGKTASITFDPPPLNFDAWRGNRSATLRIERTGGRKLENEAYRVYYSHPNYGGIPVAEGKLSDDGEIRLDGVAASGQDPRGGSYSLLLGDKSLGTFRVKDEPSRQFFAFRTPIQDGDLAPDAEAEDVVSRRKVRLASYRGRYVFLEFWATWCGPCREPMEKLVDVAERRSKQWGDRVALVAVGIDKDRDELQREIKQQRPTSIQHLWSPDFRSDRLDAASTAYSVDSVPSAFLIDPEGRILWNGHPGGLKLEAKLDALLGR
jgi:beta-lactamase regulating signal transducer with metallopeptidase domain/thiol-disulfide isomerase/thioredoxin